MSSASPRDAQAVDHHGRRFRLRSGPRSRNPGGVRPRSGDSSLPARLRGERAFRRQVRRPTSAAPRPALQHHRGLSDRRSRLVRSGGPGDRRILRQARHARASGTRPTSLQRRRRGTHQTTSTLLGVDPRLHASLHRRTPTRTGVTGGTRRRGGSRRRNRRRRPHSPRTAPGGVRVDPTGRSTQVLRRSGPAVDARHARVSAARRWFRRRLRGPQHHGRRHDLRQAEEGAPARLRLRLREPVTRWGRGSGRRRRASGRSQNRGADDSSGLQGPGTRRRLRSRSRRILEVAGSRTRIRRAELAAI